MKEQRMSALAGSLICIGIGLILIIFPTLIGDTICYILGGGVAATGAISLIGYFMTSAEDRATQKPYGLISGIALLLAGLFIIVKKEVIISIIPFVVGAMILVNGILGIQKSMNLKSMNVQNYKGSLFGGIAVAVFGLIMMTNPFESAKYMSMALGFGLVLSGLGDLFLQMRVKHYVKEAEKETEI